MSEIPSWHIVGDWFDNCSCAVACPCTFAQAPDNGFCESVLFWHVREGRYGDVKLDNLSFVRVGRWEGDALVIESAGFKDGGWLDRMGHPHSDQLRLTERFRRRDFGHLDLTLTIDDPKAYTKSWTVTETMRIAPDTELLEFACNENEKDLKHLK